MLSVFTFAPKVIYDRNVTRTLTKLQSKVNDITHAQVLDIQKETKNK